MTKEEHKQHDKEAEKSIKEIVEKYGWYVALFHATDYLPSFAYTIGLWKTFRHPEIISFGFKTETLGTILNIAGDKVKSGDIIQTSLDYDDFFDNGRAQFINVHEGYLKDHFGYGLWYNDHRTFPALQLVWTDRSDRLPWDAGFETEFVHRQPLLDRNIDFKFREAKNLATFTTRQWLELRKPILRVVHDTDGDWQFLTGDQMPEDIKIVALEQMILRDKTLNEVFNLDYGEAAERDAIGAQWTRSKIEKQVD
ncbi:DUF4262 domain-containing protein [Chryseolinea soli]|uniref:DUF4262 domain-containing protein n=1 Tax=Chryseolinea soli TaxID=2321403 RepID=A0A385SGG6_9BACT|nr:DUF4262 domain-containing protein [Chryseolinea soli]AYB30319.1 DUF4262 domain-containing protein [Chryseolinea soli]